MDTSAPTGRSASTEMSEPVDKGAPLDSGTAMDMGGPMDKSAHKFHSRERTAAKSFLSLVVLPCKNSNLGDTSFRSKVDER